MRLRLFLFALVLAPPVPSYSQTPPPFVPGGREILSLTFASEPLGEFPKGLSLLPGNSVVSLSPSLVVAEKGGARMLKSDKDSQFRITLAEPLPANFTLEFDVYPRLCGGCNPAEVEFQGTVSGTGGLNDPRIAWKQNYLIIYGTPMQKPMPPDLIPELNSRVDRIAATFEGNHFRLYTNDRLVWDLPDVRFPRSTVLRVALNGLDARDNAVYLSRLRVAALDTGAAPLTLDRTAPTEVAPRTATLTPATPAIIASTTTTSTTSSSSAATAGDRSTSTTGSFGTPSAPVGAAPEPVTPPAPGWSGVTLRLDGSPIPARLLQGGSVAASVVETAATGGAKKSLGSLTYEPIVLQTEPGSPAMDAWIKSVLTGGSVQKSGVLYGGVIVDGQQLEFSRALMTGFSLPVLDASSTSPGFFRVTLTPEQTQQNTLMIPSATTSGRPTPWTISLFSFKMPGLETGRTMRIEPLSVNLKVTEDMTGAARIATRSAATPVISNLLVTFATDARSPTPAWLSWYDSFVLKGNNGDDQEKTFSLDFLTLTGRNFLTLEGSGVGIVSLRALPYDGTTIRRWQAELYVERLDLITK